MQSTDSTNQGIQSHKNIIDAAREGHIAAVTVFLDAGTDVDTQDQDGKTALIKAVEKGHIDIVRVLIEAGADVNAQGQDGITALLRATNNGYINIVEALINAGANVNAQGQDSITALILAARNSYVDIVKVLIDADANVNTQGKYGTALIEAASVYKDKMEAFHTNTGTLSALDLMSKRTQDSRIEIVKILLDRDANVNITDTQGRTALKLALLRRQIEIVQTILKRFPELQLDKNESELYLINSAQEGYVDTVQELIDKKTNTNSQNKDGCTALMQAVKEGHENIVNALLDSGADVNAKNNMDQTALMFAADNINKEIMQALLKNGADINAQDKYGYTALVLVNRSPEGRTLIVEHNSKISSLKSLLSVESYNDDYMKLKELGFSFHYLKIITKEQNSILTLDEKQRLETLLKKHMCSKFQERILTRANQHPTENLHSLHQKFIMKAIVSFLSFRETSQTLQAFSGRFGCHP